MNLDEELRATLTEEAELRQPPRPDVEGLVRGGRIRRRRRNIARIGVTAVAVVLAGGAAYGVTQVRGESGTDPVPPATSGSEGSEPLPQRFQHLNGTAIEPGPYRMFVGADPAGVKIEADLTITGRNWTAGDQPVVSEGDTWAGVGVYQPGLLAGIAPCSLDWQSRSASRTPQTLARQLVRLPSSTVVQPPTPTEAFGHDAIHLRLRIDDPCPHPGWYQVAEGPAGSRGISYVPFKEVLIDFWVVGLDGEAVVVDLWHHADASAELVAKATRVRDSITFVPREPAPSAP